jgi:hypothetical protein
LLLNTIPFGFAPTAMVFVTERVAMSMTLTDPAPWFEA